ncbi:MAG TPA: ABC transporter permease [Candidatus Acidoferrales bacterium]|nr:ABC transporter permease [Candidatus Acidoferrales bacterium]
MRFWRRLRSLRGAIFGRARVESELDAELRFHVEAHAEDLVRSGLSREEALRQARMKLGGLERTKEECRDALGVSLVESVIQDVRFGLRMLRKNPGFTAIAVLTLALGIGANVSVFTLVDFAMLRPLPVPDPDRITIVSRAENPQFAYADYQEYRDRNQVFTGLAASFPTESSIDVDEESHLASAEAVSGNYFETMGLRPYLGRWFTDEDEPVAVLSYSGWQQLFNGDTHVLGRTVRSESQVYTVVGIAPPGFNGVNAPIQTAIWVPLQVWVQQYPEARAHLSDREHPWPKVMVFGRLKKHVERKAAVADLNAVDDSMRREHAADLDRASSPLSVEVVHGAPSPFTRRGAIPFAALFFVVVGLVLLIACVNIGNLLLARGTAREREFAVRAAVGASRVRLLRQLLVETLLLSLLGAAGGLLLGSWTNSLLDLLVASLPAEALVAIHPDLSFDSRVFAFALALSLVCTVLCGLFPAWRTVRRDIHPILKGGAAPERRARLRRVSLVWQIAVSLVLLLSAGLFLRTIYRMRASDPGFAVENRLSVLTYVSAPEFTPVTGLAFYSETLDRIRSLPGVRSAALTRFLPLMIAGQETECISGQAGAPLTVTLGVISPGFLGTMRIPLIAGRDFAPTDGPTSPPVVLVSQSLAKRFWPGSNPVGQELRVGCGAAIKAEVVGVVRDTNIRSLGESPQPHIYRPFAQKYSGLATLIVETATDSTAISEAIRSLIRGENASVRIYGFESVASHVDNSYWTIRVEATALLLFGILAVVLAAVGLYGVMEFQASKRTQEIGLRMALGARPVQIYWLVLHDCMRITVAGVVLGIVASAGVARLLAGFLSGLKPTDPLTFAVSATVWIVVALMASYVPARKAMRVDPMVALRHE